MMIDDSCEINDSREEGRGETGLHSESIHFLVLIVTSLKNFIMNITVVVFLVSYSLSLTFLCQTLFPTCGIKVGDIPASDFCVLVPRACIIMHHVGNHLFSCIISTNCQLSSCPTNLFQL